MNDFVCEDKARLVAYLYGELDGQERRAFDAHTATCAACAEEVAALAGVRETITEWMPPEPALGYAVVQNSATVLRPRQWQVSSLPAWARAVAAVLVLAVGAAIANVQVRYDQTGLTVSTGWRPAVVAASAPVPTATPAAADETADTHAQWRATLASLETSLRREMQAMRVASDAAPSAGASDAVLLRRVQSLIEESERRQRQELALRLTQLGRDLDVQRRTDLVRIEQGFGQFQGRTGAEVARQREVLNYLVRVSGRPSPEQ